MNDLKCFVNAIIQKKVRNDHITHLKTKQLKHVVWSYIFNC